MKKTMSLMLGLSLILGAASVFAEDTKTGAKKTDDTTAKKTSTKKSKRARKTDDARTNKRARKTDDTKN